MTSVTRRCAVCGAPFSWPPNGSYPGQFDGVDPPTCCLKHRAVIVTPRQMSAMPTRQMMPTEALARFPDVQDFLIGDDIQQLTQMASRPLEDRRRTFMEWIKGIDPRDEQLRVKFAAGRLANDLMEQRVTLVETLMEVARRADAFRRERLEAELTTLKLEDEIEDYHSLRELRRAMKLEAAAQEYQRLIEAGRPKPAPAKVEPAQVAAPVVDERERVLGEFRRDRQARLDGVDQMLQDFLREVHFICGSRASVHERALRLRQLLDIFELDEDTLPSDAQWLLRAAERMRDAS